MSYELLGRINSPDDVKALSASECTQLCAEIREKLIEVTSRNGGHLAPNLGVVELTVAMHRVFDSPRDRFMFDVGHQCYTHKIITGRREEIDSIRTEGGLAGFPKPSESEHDPMISGHSSTSISAACGMAKAKSIAGDKHSVVAVIGDGALTGGLAYEGLNNAGRGRDRLVIILNDNKMSISKNVGSMARYLAVIRTKSGYIKLKTGISKTFGAIPLVGKKINRLLFRSKNALKSAIYKSTLFEDMGFVYIGPVDGHNLPLLERALSVAKNMNRPVLVHVCTHKGKGYTYAEQRPRKFHGIGAFDINTGEPNPSGMTFSARFGQVMCDMAAQDESICAITAAMKSGTGLSDFSDRFHNRFFDVGIAEGHAVTFSSGLAAGGMKPVFAVYSSFIQRAYDQIIHDAAIQKLNITLAIDRAGIVGEDGETHQGIFDAAMMSTIPNIEIYSPAYFDEMEHSLRAAVAAQGPAVIRYPRGGEAYRSDSYPVSCSDFDLWGKGRLCVVSYGRISGNALTAIEQTGCKCAFMRLLKIMPIEQECIEKLLGFESIVFFEEGIASGGIGEHMLRLLVKAGYKGRFRLCAIEDGFVPHASVASSLRSLGLDSESMSQIITGEMCE